MKDLSYIIPKDKFDKEFAGNLNKYSISEVKEYIPQLLEWLQDGNWPVATPVGEYLQPHVNEIEDEIMGVLHTDDGVWKYWTLGLIYNYDKLPGDKIMAEVKRIAKYPTPHDIEEELQERAIEILEKFSTKKS